MRSWTTYRPARRAAAKAAARFEHEPLRVVWPRFRQAKARIRPPVYALPTGKLYANKGVQEAARRVRQMEARAHG